MNTLWTSKNGCWSILSNPGDSYPFDTVRIIHERRGWTYIAYRRYDDSLSFGALGWQLPAYVQNVAAQYLP